MDGHKLALAKVCRHRRRIGGRKFTSLSRPTEYPARELVSDLRHCFGFDVERNEEDIHPPSICTINFVGAMCHVIVMLLLLAASYTRSFRVAEAAQMSKPGFHIRVLTVNFVNCTVKGEDLRKRKSGKALNQSHHRDF